MVWLESGVGDRGAYAEVEEGLLVWTLIVSWSSIVPNVLSSVSEVLILTEAVDVALDGDWLRVLCRFALSSRLGSGAERFRGDVRRSVGFAISLGSSSSMWTLLPRMIFPSGVRIRYIVSPSKPISRPFVTRSASFFLCPGFRL
jgi:hypothetical protein